MSQSIRPAQSLANAPLTLVEVSAYHPTVPLLRFDVIEGPWGLAVEWRFRGVALWTRSTTGPAGWRPLRGPVPTR